MCDYSLHSIRNRLAVEGEQLVIHKFPTHSLGLASPSDLRAREEATPVCAAARWWSRVKSWFSVCGEKPIPAVCIPPGARILLRDIPHRVQQVLSVGVEEEVTFVQLNALEYAYRDAVRFKNGREILLQKLEVGQRVDVLSLFLAEEKPWRYDRQRGMSRVSLKNSTRDEGATWSLRR
jgi:hypothetical protein